MNNIDNDTTRPMNRRAIVGGLMLMLAVILAGCAGSPDCLTTQRYQNATALPRLKSPPGLQVPKADPDMQIPNVSSGPVGTYRAAPQGTDSSNPKSRCLTTPPPLNATS